MMKNLLNFSDWGTPINEGKITDRVLNSLSKTFGGQTSKIEKILSDIFIAQREYVKEWEKVRIAIDKHEKDITVREKVSPKAPDDIEKIASLKQAIKSLVKVEDAAKYKMDVKVRSLDMKAEEIYKGNARLKSYLNVRSSEYDVEIASMMHRISKKLSDKTLEKKIFGQYESASELLKRRSRQMEENYGSLAAETSDKSKKIGVAGYKKFRNIVGLTDKEFKSFIDGMDKDEMASLKKYTQEEISRLSVDRKKAMSDSDKEAESNKGKSISAKQKEYRARIRNIESDINSYKNKTSILRNEK